MFAILTRGTKAGDETSRIENLAVQLPAELRIGDNATLVFDLRNTDDTPGVYLPSVTWLTARDQILS